MPAIRGFSSTAVAAAVMMGVAVLPFALSFIRRCMGWTDDEEPHDHDHDDDGDQDQHEDHGDVDNEHFFSLWLCPYMLLSSARFSDVTDDELDLSLAQRQMMDSIADRLQLREGMRVLEIECGWGESALYWARMYGVHVTGYSRHHTQVVSATERAERHSAGPGTVRFVHGEITEERGKFDRIIRIAISEAETPIPLELYFELLHDDGLALVHHATCRDPIAQPPIQVGAPHNQFIVVNEDITNSFSQTIACWLERLTAQEQQGALRGFEEITRRWQRRLQLQSTEVDIGARGLIQCVYAKLPLITPVISPAWTATIRNLACEDRRDPIPATT